MPLVVDSSALAPLAMTDEDRTFAKNVRNEVLDGGGIAPTLFWFEVRNVLIQAEKRGRVGESETAAFLAVLAKLPIVLDHEPVSDAVLQLAREHGLTAYDAGYLELALRSNQAIATQDKQLRAAAASAGVTVFGQELA